MKKIKNILIGMIAFLIMPLFVYAATGSVKISGTSQAVIGNTVTVTVNLSSSTPIGSWNLSLNYDKNYLQLLSTDSEGGGNRMVNSSATGTKSKSYTFKFKTLKQGSTTVSISSYEAYSFADLSEISLTPSSKTIKIVTKEQLEASYSKDNNLKSLSVDGYTITPEFSKDKLEYSVVVPEDTKEIKINAQASDNKASISGTGTKEVVSGINSFEITVRAENGAEKKYKLNVDVKDNNPIEVSIENQALTVVKIKDYLETPVAFEEKTITIDDFEIPAFYNEATKLTLVGLKDETGNIGLYIYDSGKYSKYNELTFDSLIIYKKEEKEPLSGYEKTNITINDVKYDAYKKEDDSRYALIYGVNIKSGEEGYYLYDTKDKTVIKYDIEKPVEANNDKLVLYTYIIIGLFSAVVLLLIILLVVIKKKKHRSIYIEKEENENTDTSIKKKRRKSKEDKE